MRRQILTSPLTVIAGAMTVPVVAFFRFGLDYRGYDVTAVTLLMIVIALATGWLAARQIHSRLMAAPARDGGSESLLHMVEARMQRIDELARATWVLGGALSFMAVLGVAGTIAVMHPDSAWRAADFVAPGETLWTRFGVWVAIGGCLVGVGLWLSLAIDLGRTRRWMLQKLQEVPAY